ncbi:hypothetical protein [Kocuria rosea]|uniref:hypothetical protein n=1 Tax=Kocuria rosea TaxID=1275 RepID=UPI0025B79F56|nr:hypothetical protein [Kocuria rosea]WJZ68354.1 hypothetical protein QR564_18050 [Kocuria rosea]
MNQRISAVPVYAYYALAALFLVVAIIAGMVAFSRGLETLFMIVPFLSAVPALMLAFLTWQVSTGERVNLLELLITALTSLGQPVVGLITLLLTLSGGPIAWGAILFGLLSILVGVALALVTTRGIRARNRALQGTAAV